MTKLYQKKLKTNIGDFRGQRVKLVEVTLRPHSPRVSQGDRIAWEPYYPMKGFFSVLSSKAMAMDVDECSMDALKVMP